MARKQLFLSKEQKRLHGKAHETLSRAYSRAGHSMMGAGSPYQAELYFQESRMHGRKSAMWFRAEDRTAK